MLKKSLPGILFILFATVFFTSCPIVNETYTPLITSENEIKLTDYKSGNTIILTTPTESGKVFYAWQAVSSIHNNNIYFPGTYTIGDSASSSTIDKTDTTLLATWIINATDYNIYDIVDQEINTLGLGNRANLNHINTENVTLMDSLFSGKPVGDFNGDISLWNVSNVTEMSFMFEDNSDFNQDLSAWNVSNVEYLDDMLRNATSFNHDLSSWFLDSLDIGYRQLNARQEVFAGSPISGLESLKPDLLKDDVIYHPIIDSEEKITLGYSLGSSLVLPTPALDDKVFVAWQAKSDDHINYKYTPGTYVISDVDNEGVIYDQYTELVATWVEEPIDDTALMSIIGREIADSRLGQKADLNHISTAAITNMMQLFKEHNSFNGDISNWDVSQVTSMEEMFYSSAFDGDISNWIVSNVTSMAGMFNGSEFDEDISNWDVSKVTTMDNMFMDNIIFNQDISEWTPSSVTTVDKMFYGATLFEQDLSEWTLESLKEDYATSQGSRFSVFAYSPMQDLDEKKPEKLEVGSIKD